ncbi:hypothetical protein HMPREF0043_01321 [Actinobaculum sp. oral taxon 183 str. F0552]|nr:hypothetical protein HMPREF0043_01321 [Actinobaculum sp. oral taxon 183 str. F0552]
MRPAPRTARRVADEPPGAATVYGTYRKPSSQAGEAPHAQLQRRRAPAWPAGMRQGGCPRQEDRWRR